MRAGALGAALVVIVAAGVVVGCGHKRLPPIEGPPPEYEIPEGGDAGVDGEGEVDAAESP